MGNYTGGTKLYKPLLGETNWDDEVNTNFDRLSEWGLNVKSYGVVGDGTTDDSAAWLLAYEAAHVVLGGGNRQVALFHPPGVYMLDTQTISNVTNGSAIHIRGAGRHNTILRLIAGGDGILLDFGGASLGDAVNQVHISDITLDGNRGNQTAVAPVLRMRRVDRSWLTRVQIQESKGDGAEINASAVVLDSCEFANNDGDGLQFDDSNSLRSRDCFYEHNAGYGVRGLFTGTIPLLASKDEAQALFTGSHFEDNTLGDVLISGIDNVRLTGGNLFASPDTGVTKAVEFTGECRWCSVTENTFVWKADTATYDDGTGSVGQLYAIKLGTQTSECIYGNNAAYGVNFKEGGSIGIIEMLPQVQDLGVNYSVDPTHANLRQIEGQGGHTLLGWTDEQITNYMKDSADLTTARWTAANISSRTNVTTEGSPLDASGASTEVGFTASVIGTLTQSATVTVTAGEIWTLSVWAKLSAAADEPTDIQLRILNSAGAVLKKRAVRVSGSKWARYSVSMVVPSNDTAIQGRFWKAGWGTANAVYMWGAQLNKGGLAPYIPTPNGTVTFGPGAIVQNFRVNAPPGAAGLLVQGMPGAASSDPLAEWKDDSGNLLMRIRNDGVIALGADTDLYRSAADVLKTDDKLHVAGEIELDGALNHDGTTVGFYGTAPTTQQTGVAVTAAAIHAALVNLGLITA